MNTFILSAILLSNLSVGVQDSPKPIAFTGIGSHSRTISSSIPDAQKWFNQGLAFLFAFNHDEAVLAFEESARVDPKCAMAYWGIGTALGPHINNDAVEPVAASKAWKALQRAKNEIGDREGVERDLIDAALTRFSSDPMAKRAPLDLAYSKAMYAVAKKHPNDLDVQALFAEALMDLHPWNLWEQDGTPKDWTPGIKRILESIIVKNSKHPLALHLYIHVTEASSKPQDGINAARTLLTLNPGLGHMVHMPSHTFVRTGDWSEAIRSNQMAIDADTAYVAQRPNQGFYVMYMGHNHQMLAFAAMMRGQSKIAIAGMDQMLVSTPREVLEAYAPVLDGYLASVYEVRIRFGKWDEILAMPDPGAKFPVMRSIRSMARAVSYAVKGDKKKARTEQAKFYQSTKRIPTGYKVGNNSASDIMLVAEHLMNGEVLLGEGRIADAIKNLKKAVAFEDKTKYNEPPDWLQPTRHALGAVLMKAKKYAEAEAVYRADLKKLPNNGWSAFGLAKSLKMQNKFRDATVFQGMFDNIWKDADMHIDSSCLCVAGG